MILLIDAGNSRLKLSLLDVATQRRELVTVAFDYTELGGALLAWLRALPVKPAHAIGVNVSNATRGQAIAHAIEQTCGCGIQWLLSQARTLDLINHYSAPEQLGPDRWAAMLGIFASLPKQHPPFIVASFGTATTLDTVSSDNVFLGGLILPGPTMMRAALAHGTAKLPLARGAAYPTNTQQVISSGVAAAQADATAYPTNTQQAISSGVVAAQAGAVARQWLTTHARFGVSPSVYVTGGGWHEVRDEVQTLLIQAGASTGPVYVDSPVLDGLTAWALQLFARPG